jgi:hypothetical protein
MASTGKKKTTMAKLAREGRLRERRMEKAARKRARKDAATHVASQGDSEPFAGDATEGGMPADGADAATGAHDTDGDSTGSTASTEGDHPTVKVSAQDDSATDGSA